MVYHKKLLAIPFCFLALLSFFLQLNRADERQHGTLSLLPQYITESYFPYGDLYLIPEDSKISGLTQRAALQEQRGNSRQASRFYYSAYRRIKDSEKAPYLLFKYCALSENLDSSVQCLEDLLQDHPSFPLIDAVRFELSKKYYVTGEYDSALPHLQDIIENEKIGGLLLTPYVFTFLGNIYGAMGRNDEAMEYYESSLDFFSSGKAEPEEPFIMANYLGISRSMVQVKNYEGVDDLLKRIVGSASITLFQQEALLQLARFYSVSGNLALAQAVYEKIILDYPDTLAALESKQRIGDLNIQGGAPMDEQIAGIYDESLLSGRYIPGVPVEVFPPEMETVIDIEDVVESESVDRYTVQLGSFAEKKNAEAFTVLLKNKGFSAFFVEATVEDKTFYRVRIGLYEKRKGAEELMKSLEDQGYTGFIVKEK
jgi:tetratricopeptide (TPR) repeat protein